VRCDAADLYGFFINPALSSLHFELFQKKSKREEQGT
jgi:hypothetical protein